jgi:hypothetical protein
MKGERMMNKITIEVNNQGTLTMEQAEHDKAIEVIVWDSEKDGARAVRHSEIISAGDMVTLLNWYRYQKDNGNTNLTF